METGVRGLKDSYAEGITHLFGQGESKTFEEQYKAELSEVSESIHNLFSKIIQNDDDFGSAYISEYLIREIDEGGILTIVHSQYNDSDLAKLREEYLKD